MTDRAGWVTDSQYTPSVWMHPLRQDEAGCQKAIGNFVVGTLTGYDKRAADGGGDSHFFSMLIMDTNLTEAQVYTPSAGKEKGTYTPIPLTKAEVYSLRAPGNLFYQLKKYAADPSFTGVPLEITYMGLKDMETDNEAGKRIKVKAHQYQVRRDPTFQPIMGQAAIMQLTHDAPPPEE